MSYHKIQQNNTVCVLYFYGQGEMEGAAFLLLWLAFLEDLVDTVVLLVVMPMRSFVRINKCVE